MDKLSTSSLSTLDRRLSVAPMMDCTDRHFRYFLRLVCPTSLLYTEMLVSQALLRGEKLKLLKYSHFELPVALQLGGSDPADLAAAAELGEQWGYSEINLNVGCPSDRVQSGKFGACLLQEPDLVSDCIAAMIRKVKIPVTVKTRIGVDNNDSYEELFKFVQTVSAAGCRVFIIHARKALLSGLSPKQNREVPPLRYDVAGRLKKDFPYLQIILNGGIKTVAEVEKFLEEFDGVMLGRAAYNNPWILWEIENSLFAANRTGTPLSVLEAYFNYMSEELSMGTRLHSMTRHLLGLFSGHAGAREWRRILSQNAVRAGAGLEVVQEALAALGKCQSLANKSQI